MYIYAYMNVCMYIYACIHFACVYSISVHAYKCIFVIICVCVCYNICQYPHTSLFDYVCMFSYMNILMKHEVVYVCMCLCI